MGWFKHKPDPISARARALNARIVALEEEIHELDSQLSRAQSQPRWHSTALPHGAAAGHTSLSSEVTMAASIPSEPVFEPVNQNRLKQQPESNGTPEHYNELGVRKYDLVAFVRRVKNHLRGPSAMNPKLVSYLAAGSIQGLRPLRYEKRVARNRLILLVIGLLLLLSGIVSVFLRTHLS